MKTLLFCPLFMDGLERLERNVRWLNYYSKMQLSLGFDHILMVDNKSPKKYLDALERMDGGKCSISVLHASYSLTKILPQGYGYWYRAHANAASYAVENGFDKIIHIDSDAYVLTERLCQYLKEQEKGWTTFWCPKYSFPEVNIQVIGRDKIKDMYFFHAEGFLQYYPYQKAEDMIPFTNVNKDFVGDRYGETNTAQIPSMDYYCQTTNDVTLKFEMEKE